MKDCFSPLFPDERSGNRFASLVGESNRKASRAQTIGLTVLFLSEDYVLCMEASYTVLDVHAAIVQNTCYAHVVCMHNIHPINRVKTVCA